MRVDLSNLQSMDPLDLPCVSFQGHLPTHDGVASPAELRKIFTMASRPFARALWIFSGVMEKNPSVRPELRGPGWVTLPEFSFLIDARPQAYTIPEVQGIVAVNLGFFITISALSRSLRWMQRLMASREQMDLMEMFRIKVPREVLEEVASLFSLWQGMERTGRFDARHWISLVDAGAFSQAQSQSLFHVMSRLIFFHETSHWLRVAYRPEIWQKLNDRTSSSVSDFLEFREDVITLGLEQRQWAKSLLQDPKVRASWVEEVQCDHMALEGTIESMGGPSKDSGATYRAQGFLYSFVLELLDFYQQHVGLRPVNHRTHPPAQLRRAIVGHVDALSWGVSPVEYPFRYTGAGLLMFICWLNVKRHLDGSG